MIRVALPFHLQKLANVDGEVHLDVAEPVTQRAILDALEARYPVLRGTIRDHVTQKRRAFVRFFACEQDLSHDPPPRRRRQRRRILRRPRRHGWRMRIN